MARRRSILLDVDSTLYPLLTAMGTLPGGERVSYASAADWDRLPELCGGVGAMLDLFAAAMTAEAMNTYSAFEGAAEHLQTLAEDVDIHVCSDRPEKTTPGTAGWLIRQNIPFDSLTVQPKPDKLLIAREVGCSLIIDDNPKLLAAAHAAGVPIVAPRWRYNADLCDQLGLPNADNWPDLAGLARAELKLP